MRTVAWLALAGRLDSQMSVVPLMSAAMPVPEPPPVTWMVIPGFAFMYVSAQRWPRMTIVSEPLIAIDVLSGVVDALVVVGGVGLSRVHAKSVRANKNIVFFISRTFL